MTLANFNSQNLFGYAQSDTDDLIEAAISDFLDNEPTAFFYQSGDVAIIMNIEGFDEEYYGIPEIEAAFKDNDVVRYGYELPGDYVYYQAAAELLSDLRDSGELSEEEYQEIANDCSDHEWCEERYKARLDELETELSQEYVNEVSNKLNATIVQKKCSYFETFSPDTFFPPLKFEDDNFYLIQGGSSLPEAFNGKAPDVLVYWCDECSDSVYVSSGNSELKNYALAYLAYNHALVDTLDDVFLAEIADNLEFVGDALSEGATLEQLQNEGSLVSSADAWAAGVPVQDIFKVG